VRGGQAHQSAFVNRQKTGRLNGVKSAFLRRQVPSDESLRAPNPLRNPDGQNIGICPRKLSQTGMSNGSKQVNGGKNGGRTLHWSITSWLQEHFKLGSIAAAEIEG